MKNAFPALEKLSIETLTAEEEKNGVQKGNDSEKEPSLKVYFYLLMALWMSSVFFRGPGVLSNPEAPEYMASMLSNPRSLPFGIKILLTLHHMYIYGVFGFGMAFYGATIPWYVACILIITDKLT